jgi:UDP-N-acetylmuramoylalanine--D-glutamate ligase
MEINELQGKLVAVLGYGQEGKATAKYLIKHGVKPVLFDQKPWDDWPEDEKKVIRDLGINFIFGPDCFTELAGFNVAFRSPGIPILRIKDQGLKIITSQTEWFFEHCPAKIIGVTGTKGKGTTSTLIYEMLKAESNVKSLKSNSYLTGNIGKIQPLDILDELSNKDWVVYELSSFQLQDLNRSPNIAVVLMVTSEHLDYHSDQKEYEEAKTASVKYQTEDDFTVINADYENSLKIGGQGKAHKYYFSRNKKVEQGCFVQGDDIVIAETALKLPIADLKLKGAHNLENICAAALAAHLAGVSFKAIKKTALEFKGLEHRLELVAQKNGVTFYNDSFSTIPETAIAAIRSFSEPLILILGGATKKSDFKELGQIINEAKNIKAIILIGEESANIKTALNFKKEILERAKSMSEIFSQIKSVAVNGDTVLLSPACASFDMFKNYKDRGDQFKAEVSKW